MAEGKRTWGYRAVATPDGEEVSFGLYEVFYEDGLPTGMCPEPTLVSSKRDFSDVIAQISEAVRRPLHDPANPQPAPRSHLMEAGYMPGNLMDKLVPLTMPEIVQYHRNFANDIDKALAEQPEMSGSMRAIATADKVFALRIVKSLESLQDLDKVRQQLAGYLDQAREIAQADQDVSKIDAAVVLEQRMDALDGVLENAQGLLGLIYNLPGPDNCQVCLGARGGMPGNENVVDGVVMCDICTMNARATGKSPNAKPPGTNCWDPRTWTAPKDDPA